MFYNREECNHFMRCDVRGGRFHESCLEEVEKVMDETGENWKCPICRVIPQPVQELYGFVVNENGEKVPMTDEGELYRTTDVWAHSSDAVWVAVTKAFEVMTPDTLERVFQCKQRNLAEIARCNGENTYRTPRSKLRSETRL